MKFSTTPNPGTQDRTAGEQPTERAHPGAGANIRAAAGKCATVR